MAAIKRVILPSIPVMLAEGTEVFVEDGSGGLDLYIGNSSNTPVLVSANQFANQDSVVEISDIVDNLTSSNSNKPLSANQGKILRESKVSKTDGEFNSSSIVNTDGANNYNVINRRLGTVAGSTSIVILIGSLEGSNRVDIAGEILGTNTYGNHRDDVIIDLTAKTNAEGVRTIGLTLQGTHQHYDIEVVNCDYNGQTHKAIRLFGTNLNYYPQNWHFSGKRSQSGGIAENYPVLLEESSVSNITPHTNSSTSRKVFLIDQTEFRGNMLVGGEITADDFITASRVESDQENALQALDNISEWKKKDGSVDYEKHYAYKTRKVKDEEGKVIRTEPGLSMEKRVAMLEKMVYELREENRSLKTQPGEKK